MHLLLNSWQTANIETGELYLPPVNISTRFEGSWNGALSVAASEELGAGKVQIGPFGILLEEGPSGGVASGDPSSTLGPAHSREGPGGGWGRERLKPKTACRLKPNRRGLF
jgi:hypothetical protein